LKIKGEEFKLQTPIYDDDIWAKIKSKIRVDPNLGQEKVGQLWSLLDQFPNIFTWNKGELGCYKYDEHMGPIFLRCTKILSQRHFLKII
jgi:hypothetical protein